MKSILLYCLVIFLFGYLAKPILAQEAEVDSREFQFQTDTAFTKNFKFLFMPLVYYTPETRFGFGLSSQAFFRTGMSSPKSRPSNALLFVTYTLNKQIIVELKPQIYFKNESYYLNADLKFQIFPDKFWGTGINTPEDNKEPYNMQTLYARLQYLKRLPPYVNFGFEYNVHNYTMLEVQEDGLLDSELLPIAGSKGAFLQGIGAVINYDSRINPFAPVAGNTYMLLNVSFMSKAIGSNYSYNKYIIDLRKYIGLFGKSLLAIQGYGEFSFGTVPFQTMAKMGGGIYNRGYYKGRFRDNHMMTFQAELRIKPWSRWTVTAFYSLGEVANRLNEFFSVPKSSLGAGLRFQIKKDAPTLIRFDVGFGEGNQSGLYFGVNEAF